MTERPIPGTAADWILAIILAIVACGSLALGIGGLLSSNFPVTIFATITAIVFGNLAFKKFDKAAQPGPEPVETHSVETFASSLKDGRDVTFVIEISYEGLKNSASTLMRINIRILRSLNEYMLACEELYPDPLNTTDQIIQKDIKSLTDELKLKTLSLRTIDVKAQSPTSTHRSQGIYFGEHMQ